MAELGVYQGSSARIICEDKGDCPLYLFDTFAGLPEPREDETRMLRQGQYAASLSAVRSLLPRTTMFIFIRASFHSPRTRLIACDSLLYIWTPISTPALWPVWSFLSTHGTWRHHHSA